MLLDLFQVQLSSLCLPLHLVSGSEGCPVMYSWVVWGGATPGEVVSAECPGPQPCHGKNGRRGFAVMREVRGDSASRTRVSQHIEL